MKFWGVVNFFQNKRSLKGTQCRKKLCLIQKISKVKKKWFKKVGAKKWND